MPLEADPNPNAEPPGPEAGTTADVSTQDTQQSQTDALQSAWFPDEYVPLVGGYLGTMQGAGKQVRYRRINWCATAYVAS